MSAATGRLFETTTLARAEWPSEEDGSLGPDERARAGRSDPRRDDPGDVRLRPRGGLESADENRRTTATPDREHEAT